MAQVRYHNYNRPLVSFDEARRTIGLAIPGVYAGWDRVSAIAGNLLTIAHDITGVLATAQDNITQDGPMGLTISKHGVEVYETAPVQVSVAFNAGNPFIRVDWVVMNHNYLGTAGGTPASYSVIQGPNGVNFAEPAALSNPSIQTLIGKVYIPASAANLSAIAYIKQQSPKLGGYGFNKISETDIQNWGNGEIVINNLNLVTKTGIYAIYAAASNTPVGGHAFAALVLKSGTAVTQLLTDQSNGKVYSRNSTDTGVTWGPWQNLNNADVVVDFSPINTKIGSQTYTNQWFVTNGQSLTASIDALDIEAEAQLNALSTTNTNVSNLSSAIGGRTYTHQYLLANGESITASLDKLDTNLEPQWTNLVLSGTWVAVGTPVPGYTKTLDGKIRLRGQVSGGANGTLTGATAPIAPISSSTVWIPIADLSGGSVIPLNIAVNGAITINVFTAGHSYSLEGVNYQSTY